MLNFKMAYAIQCHKNPHQINMLIERINDKNIDIFVHVDKKSDIINKIINKENIYFIKDRIEVKWGGFSQVEATLSLFREIRNHGNYNYVHLISGQDYPIKSKKDIKEFFAKNEGKQFLEYFELPYSLWKYGGLNRVEVYYPQLLCNRNKFISKPRSIYEFIIMKTKIFKRNIEFLPSLYGGSSWFSITGDCMEYILDYVENNPNYIKFFENSFCSDEIFFQTIILNSKYKDSVVNDNLRYIDWTGTGPLPRTLMMKDLNKIMDSKKLFARKFDISVDKEVLENINKLIDKMFIRDEHN